MTLGGLLRRFREERGLSLRELGTLASLDHAYIHRLETGRKDAPSEEVVSTLVRALKLDQRKARIFRFMRGRDVEAALVDLILNQPERTLEDFESSAQASFRGKRPNTKEDWERVMARMQEMREEFEDG